MDKCLVFRRADGVSSNQERVIVTFMAADLVSTYASSREKLSISPKNITVDFIIARILPGLLYFSSPSEQ